MVSSVMGVFTKVPGVVSLRTRLHAAPLGVCRMVRFKRYKNKGPVTYTSRSESVNAT